MDLKKKNWHTMLIPEGDSGKHKLRHITKPAGTKLPVTSLRTAYLGGHEGEEIEFPYKARWHELSYDGGVWMTDYPIEQVQIDACIDGFEGDVLVGGLGLGYVVQALLAKPEVTSVTVVELSKDVVNLVWDHVDKGEDAERLPKLYIGDLHHWLGTTLPHQGRGEFDFCLFDIWQSDGEGTFHEHVVPLRKLVHDANLCDDANVVCWNEDIMRGQLANALMSRLRFAVDDELREMHDKAVGGRTSVESGEPVEAMQKIPTIEDLAVLRDSIYTDWSVPFFHALHTGRLELDDADEVARWYISNVGRPEFAAEWEMLLSGKEYRQ